MCIPVVLIYVQIYMVQDRKSSWDQTMLTFKSDKPNRLPVVDIAPKDIGGRQQQFGLEIGPACFL